VVPPAEVKKALFPRENGPERTLVGAVTTTATWAAAAIVVVVVPPEVVVVIAEVFTVPRVHVS
jgi:hypothetical protein